MATDFLGRALLTSSYDQVLAVPPGERWLVSHVLVFNKHTSTVTWHLHHVQPEDAGLPTDENAIVNGARLSTISWGEHSNRMHLNASSVLLAKASTTNVVTIHAYGLKEATA